MFDVLSETKQRLKHFVKRATAPQKKKKPAPPLMKDTWVPEKRMKQVLREGGGESYRSANPFPHIVIDNFLDPRILDDILHEFPAPKEIPWHKTNKENEIKLSVEDERYLGPATRSLVYALNSGPMLTLFEELTGMKGLIADPHLRGGGLHQIMPGGKLEVHADFNHYPRLNLYRRLNLLVYLNKNWNEDWNGHLELWSRDMKERVKRVAPIFNRAVLFDTSNSSYHGHPEPLKCPPGMSRKSVAMYYYTVDYPYKDDLTPHSTMFRPDRPK